MKIYLLNMSVLFHSMLLKFLMMSIICHGSPVNYSQIQLRSTPRSDVRTWNVNRSHIWILSFAKLFTGETWPVTNIKSTGTSIGKKTAEKGTMLLHYGKSLYLIILLRNVPNETNRSGQLFRHLWQIKNLEMVVKSCLKKMINWSLQTTISVKYFTTISLIYPLL